MGFKYHHGMPIPYESVGRTGQKSRTRSALLDAARELLDDAVTPTVELVAQRAGISRTTAYRYFPTQQALLAAAVPAIDYHPQAGDKTVRERVVDVLHHQARVVVGHETSLRAALRVSLTSEAGQAALRQGRAVAWLEQALTGPPDSPSGVDAGRARQLAVALRATCGIEPFCWLVDVGGLSADDAVEVMISNALAVFDAAGWGRCGVAGVSPPTQDPSHLEQSPAATRDSPSSEGF